MKAADRYPRTDHERRPFGRLLDAASAFADGAAWLALLSRNRMAKTENAPNVGTLIEVKGVVIDALFPDQLPEIYHALRLSVEGRDVIAEVQQHLGDDRVRAVAMDSTDGFARGSTLSTSASPSQSPSASRRSAGSRNVIGSRSTWRRPPTASSAGPSTATTRPSASSRPRSRSSRRGSR